MTAADPMPRHVAPMLATTGVLPNHQAPYTFEVKWDGVRAISYVRNGTLHVESRNLRDISGRYPELAGLPAALGGKDAVLDGEVVAFDDAGRPSFGRLQSRMHVASDLEVRRRMADNPVAYLIFDVLWLDGRSLVSQPWTERRAALEDLGLGLGRGEGECWKVPSTHPGEGD
ncbi:MAG: bifunctional non-ous end joining protein LigD, partial [Acidimicrobiaceae bacterium]|nr:bifunctional non-ous end joining protein LigD [Acidimicrobiaceae bacterium]